MTRRGRRGVVVDIYLYQPCAECGAQSGYPCVDGQDRQREHTHHARRRVMSCPIKYPWQAVNLEDQP